MALVTAKIWLVKCQIIYADFENNYMFWSNNYLIFPLRKNWVATQFNLLWLQ